MHASTRNDMQLIFKTFASAGLALSLTLFGLAGCGAQQPAAEEPAAEEQAADEAAGHNGAHVHKGADHWGSLLGGIGSLLEYK